MELHPEGEIFLTLRRLSLTILQVVSIARDQFLHIIQAFYLSFQVLCLKGWLCNQIRVAILKYLSG